MYHDLQCIYVFILGAGFVMTPTWVEDVRWEYVDTSEGNGKDMFTMYGNLGGMSLRFKLSQYLIPMWCARIIQNSKTGELKQIFHWRKTGEEQL